MAHVVWAHWIHASPAVQLHPLIILDTGTIYFTAIQEVLHAHNYPVFCIDPTSASAKAIVEEVATRAPSLILMGAWLDQAVMFDLLQGIDGAWPLVVITWDFRNEGLDLLRLSHANHSSWPTLSSTLDLEEFLAKTLRG